MIVRHYIYIYIYIYAQRPPLDPQFPCVFHRTSWSYRATDASARICQQQSSCIILYLQFEHVIIIHEQDSRHENWALLETPPTRKQGELRVLAQSRCLAIHWWRHGSTLDSYYFICTNSWLCSEPSSCTSSAGSKHAGSCWSKPSRAPEPCTTCRFHGSMFPRHMHLNNPNIQRHPNTEQMNWSSWFYQPMRKYVQTIKHCTKSLFCFFFFFLLRAMFSSPPWNATWRLVIEDTCEALRFLLLVSGFDWPGLVLPSSASSKIHSWDAIGSRKDFQCTALPPMPPEHGWNYIKGISNQQNNLKPIDEEIEPCVIAGRNLVGHVILALFCSAR